MTDKDLSSYRVIAKFDAFIRRPEPLKTGMTALLFAENGPHADEVNKLGISEYQDAFVSVEMFDGQETMDGFFGYIRRPKPLVSGMIAQFFGENGDDSDKIAALSLSNFLDMRLTFCVRYIQDPAGKDMKKAKGPYSEAASLLWRSSFFATPDVWVKTGTDKEFLAWVITRPCCISKEYGNHKGDIVPMHVRRVANGSGTSIKPEYSAIAGCWFHHNAMQHQSGESAVGGRDFFDRQRIQHLRLWGWQCLVSLNKAESMTFVPPEFVYSWAVANSVDQYLPLQYRKFVRLEAGNK